VDGEYQGDGEYHYYGEDDGEYHEGTPVGGADGEYHYYGDGEYHEGTDGEETCSDGT